MFGYNPYSYGSSIGGYVFVIIIICMVAYAASAFILRWNLFTKAGERGWKSLIPVYSDFVEWKIVGMGKEFFIVLIATVALCLLTLLFSLLGVFGTLIIALSWIVYSVLAFIIIVRKGMRMAACFNKSDLFGLVALVIFPSIGDLILSWGECTFTPYEQDVEYDADGNVIKKGGNLLTGIFSDIKAGRVIDG